MESEPKETPFRKIFRATAISGLSSATTILANIMKGKVIAVFLGPSGIGLFGLLQSVLTTVSTISGMGINSSGIRQIAEVHAKNDAVGLAAAYQVMWRAALLFGIIGAIILVMFRQSLAKLALGDVGHSGTLAWVGIAVVATTLAAVQSSLLNGLRKIEDLARINIVGAASSTLVALPAVYFCGEHGVTVTVVLTGVLMLAASTWYSRTVVLQRVSIVAKEQFQLSKKLLGLGFVFMASSLMTVGTQLVVRSLIARNIDIAASGQFQAAWSISMLYLGFVLNAMGTEYYPRLSAVANDRETTNTMVNQQVEVVLLLACPIILLMLILSPQLVRLLYSGAFLETSEILRWQFVGDIFKVVSWTVAFILLAKGQGKAFFVAEVLANLLYLMMIFVGIERWGVTVTGIAFLVMYVFYLLLICGIVYKTNKFMLSKHNIILLTVFSSTVVATFVLTGIKEAMPFTFACLLALFAGWYSFVTIKKHLGGALVKNNI